MALSCHGGGLILPPPPLLLLLLMLYGRTATGNLFVQGGWTLCAAPPGVGGGSHDTFIDSDFMWRGICGNDKCLPLWEENNATHQTSPGQLKPETKHTRTQHTTQELQHR